MNDSGSFSDPCDFKLQHTRCVGVIGPRRVRIFALCIRINGKNNARMVLTSIATNRILMISKNIRSRREIFLDIARLILATTVIVVFWPWLSSIWNTRWLAALVWATLVLLALDGILLFTYPQDTYRLVMKDGSVIDLWTWLWQRKSVRLMERRDRVAR